MRKYIPILILFSISAFFHPILAQNSEDFNSVEKEQINREVLTIVNSYQKYGGLTETFTYISNEYVSEFQQLFAPQASILNDIGSTENQEEYISIEEYMSIIQAWYPEGLAIEFEDFIKSKHIGSPYKYKDKFAVRTNLNKKTSALTKDYEKVGKVDTITIIIAFDKDLTKFEITEVNNVQPLSPEDVLARVTKKKDKLTTEKEPKKEKRPIAQKEPKKENKPIAQKARKKPTRKKGIKLKLRKPRLYKRENKAEKGLFASLLVNPYLFNSKFQLNETLKNTFNMEGVSITSQPLSLGRLRVEADYFLTENFGVGAGIGLNTYKSNIDVGTLHYIDYDVEEEGLNEEALTLEYRGGNILEKVIYRAIDFSVMFKYKQSISNNLFLYGGIGAKFAFTNFRSPSVDIGMLGYENFYDNSDSPDSSTHGFIPRNAAEAEFLEEYNLYIYSDEEALNFDKNTFIFKKEDIMFTADFGIAYPISKRLKVKAGGMVTFGGNILGDLPSPDPQLGLVEVSVDNSDNTKVRNDYLSLANRKGNQWNIRAVGIEIGLMYKIGNIDIFR